jgi:hypothetical protein
VFELNPSTTIRDKIPEDPLPEPRFLTDLLG